MQTITTIPMPQDYRNKSWFVMLEDKVWGGVSLAEFVIPDDEQRYACLYKNAAETQAEIDEFHQIRQDEVNRGERDFDDIDSGFCIEACAVDSNGFVILSDGRVRDGNEFGSFHFS